MLKKYHYTARDWQGQKIKDSLTAENRAKALEFLRSRGLVPVHLSEKNLLVDQIRENAFKILKSIGYSPFKSRDLMVFCRQFATMLYSGVPILQCLEILSEQGKSTSLKKQINSVALDVEQGQTLAAALQNRGSLFPVVMTGLVESGETSGKLDLIMDKLADHFEKQHDFNVKVRSATFYPAFVIGTSLAVMVIMVLFVLPQFARVFNTMGMELPLYTRVLIEASSLARQYWLYIAVTLGFAAVVLSKYVHTKKGRLWFDILRLRCPFFGNIYRQSVAARFSRTLSTLLAGGVTLHAALILADKVIDNAVISISIGSLSDALNRGETIAGHLKEIKYFPGLLPEMVRVGEETGTLEQTLHSSAVFYEREVSYIVDRLTTILEPALLLIVGLFIGLLVYSILAPMYQVFQMV
ncbi:MAG: type II secretion system F family protein [Bacillota bacterium]